MTAAEVINIAFTRNLSTGHITSSDIAIAKRNYVDKYISGYTVDSVFYNSFVKPVIAFGVATDIYNRIATEITDRGVVKMTPEGAQIVGSDDMNKTLREFETQRDNLIEIMCSEAETVTVEVYTYSQVGRSDKTNNIQTL